MARLRKNQNGRWEVFGGIDALRTTELTSGDVVFIEVDGHDELQPTRIEFARSASGAGEYVSMDDYPLWSGMRAEVEQS